MALIYIKFNTYSLKKNEYAYNQSTNNPVSMPINVYLLSLLVISLSFSVYFIHHNSIQCNGITEHTLLRSAQLSKCYCEYIKYYTFPILRGR